MATGIGSRSEDGTLPPFHSFYSQLIRENEERNMRGILLWAIGVPIPIIILIYLLF